MQLKEKYKDWFLYTTLEDGEMTCYIISYPKEKSKHYTSIRKPYVMVSYINKEVDEVSVTSGFQYDKEPVVLDVDKKVRYVLPIVQGNFAWTEYTETDKDLILKMKQGLSMVVSGKTKAEIVNDTYSLLGFQEAYKKMHNSCYK
ncbi:invasion associated locus B family protein [Wolbachia endosymbiont of Cruorifilaria tuberocauda]|uniref:invasion associated locus B family protein n=1 Tax=Wolbachia endosymbiont of Cruorifilaria tuberocauda TaxID=1812111 RepID=UPI001FEAE2FA|nr:invasion associated locus B family protein [Wolbachia endosymbiont of Cruorifilaria tuberocauda]